MSDSSDSGGCLVFLLFFCLFIQCNNIEILEKKIDKLNNKVEKVLEKKL